MHNLVEDCVNFCGLLRKYELYLPNFYLVLNNFTDIICPLLFSPVFVQFASQNKILTLLGKFCALDKNSNKKESVK